MSARKQHGPSNRGPAFKAACMDSVSSIILTTDKSSVENLIKMSDQDRVDADRTS